MPQIQVSSDKKKYKNYLCEWWDFVEWSLKTLWERSSAYHCKHIDPMLQFPDSILLRQSSALHILSSCKPPTLITSIVAIPGNPTKLYHQCSEWGSFPLPVFVLEVCMWRVSILIYLLCSISFCIFIDGVYFQTPGFLLVHPLIVTATVHASFLICLRMKEHNWVWDDRGSA